MLKAAWHWGSDCSVVNDPNGEPGCTPLYVGLPTTWGSVDIIPVFRGRLLIGDYDGYKQMNKPLVLEMKHLSPKGTCWGTHREACLLGTLREKVNY